LGALRYVKTPQVPATFSVRSLTIYPPEVQFGESVTVSALVANSGDLAGNYKAVLKIDDATVETRELSLAGGASEQVTFTVARDIPGAYTVSVENLLHQSKFEVLEYRSVLFQAPGQSHYDYEYAIDGYSQSAGFVAIGSRKRRTRQ